MFRIVSAPDVQQTFPPVQSRHDQTAAGAKSADVGCAAVPAHHLRRGGVSKIGIIQRDAIQKHVGADQLTVRKLALYGAGDAASG